MIATELTPDQAELLAREELAFRTKRLDGYAYKLAGDQFGLDVSFAGDTEIDERSMSVVISFGSGLRRDGVGDLLEISGIDTERHRKNPICLFDHGKQITLPVALTEDPKTGEYTVELDNYNREARAKCFFYQGGPTEGDVWLNGESHPVGGYLVKADDHALFCNQLFDLIAKKFVRAGSIGYQVIKSYPLPPDPQTGIMKGLHLLETLMLECSVVVLPANGDTVRKALSLPAVCGKPLSPWLVKSLTPYAEPKKAQLGYEGKPVEKKSLLVDHGQKILGAMRDAAKDTHHGVTINDLTNQLGIAAEDLRDAIDELLRSGEIKRNYHDWKIYYQLAGDPSKSLRLHYRTKGGERMAQQPAQDKPPMDAEKMPGEATAKNTEMEEPFGASTLRQMHADHKLLMNDYARMHKLNDHPAVKKALEKKLGAIDKEMSEWENIWGQHYKDLKPLEGAMGDNERDPEVEGVEADSEEEELPPPEEAAEEMEKETLKEGEKKKKSVGDYDTKGVKPPRKTGKNPKGATAHCGQYERCYNPNEARRYTHTKSTCPSCGMENCDCNKGEGIENGHMPGTERSDPEPGYEYHGEPNVGSHHPGMLHDHEMKAVGGAHHFLGELSGAGELSDMHRMDAWHHSKVLHGISLAEANDKVENNLGNHEVPPSQFEPGAGAMKSQPSDKISPEKARQILHDGEVRGHPLTEKQRGLFGAAAGKKDMVPGDAMEPAAEMEGVQPGPETAEEGMESHRKMCGKAAAFLQEIATGKDWGDTHREKSQFWHKTLGGMLGSKSDAAEAAAAVHEVGTMKSLNEIFAKQDETLAALNKQLALLGVN